MQAVFDMLSRAPHPLLIVGGHALAAHGVIRQTIDIDCLIIADDRERFAAHIATGGYRQIARTDNFARYAHTSPDVPAIDALFVGADTFAKLKEETVPLRRGSHEFRVPGLSQLIALKFHAIRNDPRREYRDLPDIAELLRLNPGKISRSELEDLCRRFGPAGMCDKLPDLR
jgi:hypothetical protein